MKTKHKSSRACKSKTRSGRKCSRIGNCEKGGMCSQHHRISKERISSKSKSKKSSSSKSAAKSKVYVYYTLDNGGRPFKVEISENNTVSIYEQDMEESDKQEKNIYEEKPFKIYNPEKIFIGKSILLEMTEFSGARDDPKWDGNSILLEMNSKKLEYIHIGATVYSFTAYDKIREYVSPVGNSGTPYPYAVDKSDNYYLMIEDISFEVNNENKDRISKYPDPYEYYYDNTKMYDFENNKGLKFGNEKVFFTFSNEDFDKMKKRFDNAEIYVIKKDGTEEVMNKKTYKALMDRFAKFKGFKPFLDKVMVHERLE